MKRAKPFVFCLLFLLTLLITSCDKDSAGKPTSPPETEPTATTILTPTIAPTATPLVASEGLKFTKQHTDGYYVSAIGTCTDTTVIIPVEYNGAPVTGIASSAFDGNQDIKKVIMQHSIKVIEQTAFKNCSGLEEIIFSENLTTIEREAFSFCTGLKEIKIPDRVTVIEEAAFMGCTSLENVVLGKSVEKLLAGCFASCNIKSIYFPASFKLLAESTICTNALEQITIDPANRLYQVKDNCLMLGDTLMLSNKNGNLPEGTVIIGDGAFYQNTNLEDFIIPEGIISLGKFSFGGCENLKNISLPQSLALIETWAFTACDNLTNIIVPKATSLQKQAFYECHNLTHVYYEGKMSEWNYVSLTSEISTRDLYLCVYADSEEEIRQTDTSEYSELFFWRYIDGKPIIYDNIG
ncbi:MAG: leucine-rich repeat domain-containing protein [Ruminococcaceae bacterium]|nr:leucine-rich repeat domain-containing protein [Oscillospiraceae bacterium]